MVSQMQSMVTAVVGGRPLGIFDSRSGGETTAEVTKRRRGGMQPERAYPGMPAQGDITIARDNDDFELTAWLRTQVGLASASITDQPLGTDAAPWGRATTYNGILSGVNDGEHDANSSDPRLLELTFSITGIS